MKKLWLSLLLSVGLMAGMADAKPSYSGGGSNSSSSSSSSHSSSSGSSSSSGHSYSAPSRPAAAARSSSHDDFDSAAADDARRAASRHANSSSGSSSASPSYSSSNNSSSSSSNSRSYRNDSVSQSIRRTYTTNTYVTRNVRFQTCYGPRYSYYSSRPRFYYHDPINDIFWYWLLDQSIDVQAQWAYNHREQLDDARYQSLLNQNAAISARMLMLQSQGVTRDPSYTPRGMDPDLQYSDDYVKSVASDVPAQSDPDSGPTVSTPFLAWFLMSVILVIVLIGGLAILLGMRSSNSDY
jgi:hypothetical protein